MIEENNSQQENVIEIGKVRLIYGYIENYNNNYSPDNPMKIYFEKSFTKTPLVYLTGRGDSHNYVGGSELDEWKGFCGLEYCSIARASGNGSKFNYLIIGEK